MAGPIAEAATGFKTARIHLASMGLDKKGTKQEHKCRQQRKSAKNGTK
jgi:hypothetical protein